MIINGANVALLNQGFKATFQGAFAGYKPMWDQVATMVPSSTSEEVFSWLGNNPRFSEWLSERQIQNLKQYDWRVKNRTFEMTVGVKREAVEDDQYGVYSPMIAQMGFEASAHPDSLVFPLLPAGFTLPCYDGQYFFDTDHPVGAGVVSNFQGGAGTPWYVLDTTRPIKPLLFQKRRDYKFVAKTDLKDDNVFESNEFVYGVDCRVNASYGLWQLAYGSKQTLDETNLAAAIAAMKAFKADSGLPLNVSPNVLVVPPSLELAADKLVTALYGANGASNVMAGKLKVMAPTYLS